MTKLLRSYLGTFFECESHVLTMQMGCIRDKAYGIIRCETKQVIGAADMGCSRKGVLR